MSDFSRFEIVIGIRLRRSSHLGNSGATRVGHNEVKGFSKRSGVETPFGRFLGESGKTKRPILYAKYIVIL